MQPEAPTKKRDRGTLGVPKPLSWEWEGMKVSTRLGHRDDPELLTKASGRM